MWKELPSGENRAKSLDELVAYAVENLPGFAEAKRRVDDSLRGLSLEEQRGWLRGEWERLIIAIKANDLQPSERGKTGERRSMSTERRIADLARIALRSAESIRDLDESNRRVEESVRNLESSNRRVEESVRALEAANRRTEESVRALQEFVPVVQAELIRLEAFIEHNEGA